jgi:hypothetical protein
MLYCTNSYTPYSNNCLCILETIFFLRKALGIYGRRPLPGTNAKKTLTVNKSPTPLSSFKYPFKLTNACVYLLATYRIMPIYIIPDNLLLNLDTL